MTIEAKFAGVIGEIFGRADKEVLKGDVVASLGRVPLRSGERLCLSSSQFLPDYQTQVRPIVGREWQKVPRDHSRSRHGNRRGF